MNSYAKWAVRSKKVIMCARCEEAKRRKGAEGVEDICAKKPLMRSAEVPCSPGRRTTGGRMRKRGIC
ncbi:hypothetical protein L596_008606 [Steinernema carpocapsae]|uniref:Uncharacterized protein n=1 Tax=Steinernema carpocapsae TaxID=34508 RepID=A0A4U5PD06_STECR|nr:hypothetical protein L596_008606 [Steinernema carpocapsae]